MEKSNLTSTNIGCRVWFNDEMYDEQLKKFVPLVYNGVIESLLIDINFGAYGFKVKTDTAHKINFILKNEDTYNLVGMDLDILNFH